MLPALMHDPRALPQGDARRRPARHGCPVSRFRHLEIVHTGDMLDDAIASPYESRPLTFPGKVLETSLTESEAI
jgi:hypothetical protein